MRHYEIIFLVHPERSDQIDAMLTRYRALLDEAGGKVHRLEDWGRRQLSYPIQKVHKAAYVLMNIECEPATLGELKHAFQFNDAVIRHLVVRRNEAVTAASPLVREKERERDKDRGEREDGATGGEEQGAAAAMETAEEAGAEAETMEAETTEAAHAPETQETTDAGETPPDIGMATEGAAAETEAAAEQTPEPAAEAPPAEEAPPEPVAEAEPAAEAEEDPSPDRG